MLHINIWPILMQTYKNLDYLLKALNITFMRLTRAKIEYTQLTKI